MIPIQNIYYMLSYAFTVLKEQEYKNIATEQFANVADMCSAILIKGVSVQIKRGLMREYIERTESLSSLRGRMEISESIKKQTMIRKQLVCSYDEFSVNSYLNRIIKTTMIFLLQSKISAKRKKEIKKLLLYLSDVDTLDIHMINWNVRYDRNNQTYRMLISICWLAVKGLLQTTSDGTVRLMDFLDERPMNKLYEKFILEYYRKEFPKLTVNSSRIDWATDDGVIDMLPNMKSDVMISYENTVLIIDAKYYSSTTQNYYDVKKFHSSNLYQIFAYVKNKDAEFGNTPHEVSGMLLYAKTDEEFHPKDYQISGNKISVNVLDLNCDFEGIKSQLNDIVKNYFDDNAIS